MVAPKHPSSSYFFKSLIRYLIPVLSSLTILGVASVVITENYLTKYITRVNIDRLTALKNNFVTIVNESENLNLAFSTDFQVEYVIEKYLNSDVSELSEYQQIKTVKSFINAQAYSRPYIESIYIYIPNDQNLLLTTSEGMILLDDYYDTRWYSSYIEASAAEVTWQELRTVQKYRVDRKGTRLLTFYRRIIDGNGNHNGVIVLNLDVAYLENLLGSAAEESERIAVFSYKEKLLLANEEITDSVLDSAVSWISKVGKKRETQLSVLPDTGLLTFQLDAPELDWIFVSLIKENDFYALPQTLRAFTFVAFLFSIAIGILWVYRLTRRRFLRIQAIEDMIDRTAAGATEEKLQLSREDEYDYIISNIIKTFIEKKYLRVQLSERKYKQEVLEMRALQTQLNPHFLYNTLETVNWKILEITRKPASVNKMINNLSSILKYSLRPPGVISIWEEIENAKHYLEIQGIRYRDKFFTEWIIDPGLDDCLVLTMLLQPVIENAIYHGIKEARGKQKLTVQISLMNEKERSLLIKVIDTGIGIPLTKINEINAALADPAIADDHIGLVNTAKRIHLKYGKKYGIQLESTENEGTRVSLIIPYIPSE